MKLGHKRMCMLVSAEPTEVHHHLPASYINEPSVQQIRVRHSSCSSTRILKLQSCCIDNQGPTFIISKKHPPPPVVQLALTPELSHFAVLPGTNGLIHMQTHTHTDMEPFKMAIQTLSAYI